MLGINQDRNKSAYYGEDSTGGMEHLSGSRGDPHSHSPGTLLNRANHLKTRGLQVSLV
jgi:hypothetical protein